MPDHGGGSREPPRLHLEPRERTAHHRTWATTADADKAAAVGACLLLALAPGLAALFVKLLIDRLSHAPGAPDWPALVLLATFTLLAWTACVALTPRARGTVWSLDRTSRTITRTRTSLFGAQSARTWHDHDIAAIRREDFARSGAPYAAVTLDLTFRGAIDIAEGLELHLISQLAADLRWALHRDRGPMA